MAQSGFGNLAANGDTHGAGDYYQVKGNQGVWVHISGAFGAGTFKLQFLSLDGATWRDIQGSSKTTADDTKYDLPHNTKIRGNLAGATGPSLNWEFMSVAHRN